MVLMLLRNSRQLFAAQDIPLGMAIHNVELRAGRWNLLSECRDICHGDGKERPVGLRCRCPVVRFRRVPAACRASIGKIGNSEHSSVRLGKAGRKRWLGRRPHVRGTAMNPIDHPHGGGEGRTKGGRHPVGLQGRPAKGGSTRQRRKPSNAAIVRRRRSKRYGVLRIKVIGSRFGGQ